MKFIKFLIITLLMGTGVSAAAVPLDRIVAVVNDDVVMESELRERVRSIRGQIQESGQSMPPTRELEREVLDQIVLNKLQLQLAENSGIRVDDETLNRAISEIASRNQLTLSQFRQILEQDGYDFESFRQNIRDEMIIARLRQRHIENRITVTDFEINNYLATQQFKEQSGGEEEYRLSHILIAVPEGASDAEIEQRRFIAEKVLEDARAGRDFAELAVDVSDGLQAQEGGDLGWRKQDQLPSLFRGEVQGMSEGDVTDIIENPSGFHIVQLTEVRSGGQQVVSQTRARHILIRPNELNPDEKVRLRLDQLRQRIQGGTDFGELARAHSDDTLSAVEGGDLGWLSPGDLVPEFEQMMNTLEPGEISVPFQTDFGWHIVELLDRRDHDSTEEIRRAQAREAIRQRKVEEAMESWLREVRDEAYVEYRLEQ